MKNLLLFIMYGSAPRSIRSTCGTASFVITTQSAVTAGLGYLYVYAIIDSTPLNLDYHKAPLLRGLRRHY